MITISDEKRLLNLDYFTIYLLLTPEQIQMYGDKLKNVNKHTRITRGLFHVEIIQKGKYAYKELPEDMLRYINDHNFNVLARLVNEIHGNFCYGMESVDVGNPSIFFMLEQFSRNLSYANIKNLDILMNRNTNSGREAMRIYNESNIAMELFQDAFVCNIGKFKRWTKDEVPNLFESSDTKTSSELVEEAFGNSKLNTIRREQCATLIQPRRTKGERQLQGRGHHQWKEGRQIVFRHSTAQTKSVFRNIKTKGVCQKTTHPLGHW